MKRSLQSEQVLALNVQDFERAGLLRKSGYKFSISLKNGKAGSIIINYPLASSLSTVLLEDRAVQELLQTNEFQISLNPKFELTIKHIPSVAPEVTDTVEAVE